MKKINILLSLLAAGLLVGTSALAVDYSSYSTEELSAMRGTLRNASAEERNAFRQEWQSRMQSRSTLQRDAVKSQSQRRYRYGSGSQSVSGNGNMMYGSGSRQGGGHRYGGGKGHGGGRR